MLFVYFFSKSNSDKRFTVKSLTRRWQRSCGLLSLVAAVLVLFGSTLTAGIFEINREPINYKTTPVQDRIQLLKQRLEEGTAKLEWDE